MPTITHKRRKRQPEKVISRRVDNSETYNSQRWRRTSKSFLSERENAFCVICLQQGRYTVATITDHVNPITQGGAIWDRSNWQPICKTHHNQKSGREAHSRFNR
jgi:5-methylcytosine-specific restriction protein A